MTRSPGIILAGGLSRRMGENKAAVLLGGKTMIRHVAERLAPQVSSLVVNAPEGADAGLGLPLVPDTIAGHPGPLAGVLAGLRHAEKLARPPRHIVTVPADTPFLPCDLVERLEAALPTDDAIVVASSMGRSHPVIALWPIAVADDLEEWLADPGNRRLQAFIARHPSAAVDFPPIETKRGPLDPLYNVNTPDELALAKAFLEEEDG
ncbi:molybdenum cofactor guanylyltransferase MobA [Ciceribacter thiooxidans]|uniref:Molybdenum cofactor guanylyltransferase n=1 Tax=Ciceribacter thiooxidans TaxID=1969821 RepID=A0ABV7I7F6_9HYPH|nr:molybdenum cofactor guanylyltransferase MobA [Ciceribacter thiooxidans]